MDSSRLKIFSIVGLLFRELEEEVLNRFRNTIVSVANDGSKWWVAEDGLRFSLVKPSIHPEDVVSCWLTQQHLIDRHEYDDQKQESVFEVDSYEDRILLIDLAKNLVILEWRQFRQRKPLSSKLYLDRVRFIIQDLLCQLNLEKEVALIPFAKETTKEDFIRIFFENRIIELSIEDFGGESIPADAVIVNPNPHLEGAVRELVRHDFLHPSIQKVLYQTNSKGNGDLRASAFVRASLFSGKPGHIVYEKPSGSIRARRRTENGEFEVDIPVSEDDSVQDRIEITSAIMDKMRSIDIDELPVDNARRAATEQADLFSQLEVQPDASRTMPNNN